MSREEAITILIREIDEDPFMRTEYREQIHEALDMAIKALVQEPCEDAISRENTIEQIKIAQKKEYTFDYASLIDFIKVLPPVNPQPKNIGHWITTRTFMHDGEYYCDKCKCDAPNNEKWDYCPNCGAKMVEVQERSDKECR